MTTRKMNRLALNRGYLCGAMDRVLDGGVGGVRTCETTSRT